MNPLYCQCKSVNVCGRNVTSKLAPINLIRSGQVERRRTQASKRQPSMHGTEALQVDIQFRVVPNACALLQSALKEPRRRACA